MIVDLTLKMSCLGCEESCREHYCCRCADQLAEIKVPRFSSPSLPRPVSHIVARRFKLVDDAERAIRQRDLIEAANDT